MNVALPITRWRRGRYVLTVDAGGHADFSTIGAAVDYAATHTPPAGARVGLPSGAWWIVVEPGSYWERPFTLPAHTYLLGTGFDPRNDTSPRVLVSFAHDSQGDMITFSRGSCLAHMAVYFLGTSNPFWSNSISGPTRVVRIPGIASGYWQIYGCLIGAQVDSTAHPVTAVDWDGAGQVYQQLQVIGSQVSILGPAGIGVNGTGLRVAQAAGTGTSLLVRDSELVSTFGAPAVAIDLDGVADARLAGVAVRGFTTHLAAAQSSAVTVARSDLRVVTADAGSTVREGVPPVPVASSDPGYEGLVTVDGGFIYRHDGSQWVRAPLAFGAF